MNIPGTETVRRTAAQEEEDGREVLQNLLDKKYNDWPNEAGVSGIPRAAVQIVYVRR